VVVGWGEEEGGVNLRLGYICICEMFFPDFGTDGSWLGGWYHRDPGLRVSFALREEVSCSLQLMTWLGHGCVETQ